MTRLTHIECLGKVEWMGEISVDSTEDSICVIVYVCQGMIVRSETGEGGRGLACEMGRGLKSLIIIKYELGAYSVCLDR